MDQNNTVPEEKVKTKSSKKKNDEVEKLREQILDLENQFKRAVADYRNLEKRFDEEKREYVKFANRDMLLRLIPAFDTLFLAEKFISDESIKLTVRHLSDVLRDIGVERVVTDGQMYNPEFMEVVSTEDGGEDKVLEELRPGFTLNGKLLRPAQVKVGKKLN